jgi:hypothetical protein
MVYADPSHVLKRLKELRDWAEYIHLSLTEDQPYELYKLRVLNQLLGWEKVDRIRESSGQLLRVLSEGIAASEHSMDRLAKESATIGIPAGNEPT